MASKSPSIPAFPPVMNAYFHWGQLKTFDLCGASKNERLCLIEAHSGISGISGKGPLGTRPGLLLHNGMSRDDPVLAAVGDESFGSSRIYAFNLNSVVLMPPLDSNPKSSIMVTEMMRAGTTDDHIAAFRFSIEVDEKMRREEFEWKRIKERDNRDAKSGGFKLVRLSSGSAGSDNGSSQRPSKASTADDGCETVAVLAWTMTWLGSMHGFSLLLDGSGKSGLLGERWALMTVMTALRIFILHSTGRANKTIIGAGEKIRGKDSAEHSKYVLDE